MKMNIIIIDSNLERARKHSRALHTIGFDAWLWDVTVALRWNGDEFVHPEKYPDRFDWALVHQGDFDGSNGACVGNDKVVLFSGGGMTDDGPYAFIPRGVDESCPLSELELQRICEHARISEDLSSWRSGVRKIFNFMPDLAFLAFRLLCEAWKIVNIDNTPDCEGFTIHAPETLADWLQPFDKKPSDPNAIEDVLALIGSEKIKGKAELVLKAVGGEENDLKNAVLEFLGETASPPT